MKITFEPVKRGSALQERGLDFARADEVFSGTQTTILDDRRDYGEVRMITVGYVDGRMVVMVWTPRGESRRIISMRKADDREQERFADRLG